MASEQIRVEVDLLAARTEAALAGAGATEPSRQAATRAMMHASLHGIDSHGVRLAAHYARMLVGGRLTKDPQLGVKRRGASAMVDGDDGLGHYASYHAVDTGIEIARELGIAGVGIRRSSHLGAAGAYALYGAEQGFITFFTTNTDSMVAAFDGAKRFHGTNPLAFSAPVPGENPWLMDMATSSIPMNRVLLYRTLGETLPEGIAADSAGQPTRDPAAVDMLLPLGGESFGFKGAALAGIATLLSAVLTDATLDPDFIPMIGSTDISTPRNMGHFVIVIDPDKFAGSAVFGQNIQRYLTALRAAPVRAGGDKVMAPGDREWAVAEERRANGIPIDPETAAYLGF